jgi:hypothetical protein
MRTTDSARNRSTIVMIGAMAGSIVAIVSAIPYYRPDYSGPGHFLYTAISFLFVPGFLGSVLISHNVHNAGRPLAIVLNWLFYSSLFYGLLRWRIR